MPHHTRRGNAVVLIVIILVAVAGVFVFMSSKEQSVSGNVETYLTMLDRTDLTTTSGAKPQAPAVIIDQDRRAIDDLHTRLSVSLRTDVHGEVGSIFILSRSSSGLPGAGVGLPLASANTGYYALSAYVLDAQGTLLQMHSVRRETVASGAGFEAEVRPEVEAEMLEWIQGQLQ